MKKIFVTIFALTLLILPVSSFVFAQSFQSGLEPDGFGDLKS